MITLINILYTISIIAIIFNIRNYLVFKNTKKAMKYIYSQSNWIELQKEHLSGKYYNRLLLNPLVWTYKQMFKGLENEQKDKT